MGDVVSIEVDGEPGEPRFETNGGRPKWGMPVAIVVVGVLVLGVGWTVLRSGGASTASSAAPIVATPTTTVRETHTSTEVPLVRGGATTTIPAVPTTTTVPTPDMHDPVEATRVALAAWGDFAITGDLTRVRLLFSAGGPQLTQLEDEAARITRPAGTSGPGYVVTLSEPTATVHATTATVTGTVVWTHPAEPDQTYRWAIEMHRADDGSWRLFTVRAAKV